ncbi:MAG: lytic murein transglycosylase [Xanthomonadaceae bacterium]|nr:lytic murein transglycosylase [Xanthomonadaceae bacterium]
MIKKLALIITLFVSGCAYTPEFSAAKLTDEERKDVLLSKLKLAGVQQDFIDMIFKSPRFKLDSKYIKMSVLIFKLKSDYTQFLQGYVVANGRLFLKKYRKVFAKVEKIYGVPKEVITALISVETRLGRNTGSENIASVFFSLAMADQEDICKSLVAEVEDDMKPKIPERCQRKADWARGEILSLQDMYIKRSIPVGQLSGSFAGAFGLPQFVPSSFMKWASPGPSNDRLDLYEADDAITSVANYLKVNGWTINTDEQRAALFHYNRSQDYGNTILQLAELLKAKPVSKKKKI